jgi:hypothetical protein
MPSLGPPLKLAKEKIDEALDAAIGAWPGAVAEVEAIVVEATVRPGSPRPPPDGPPSGGVSEEEAPAEVQVCLSLIALLGLGLDYCWDFLKLDCVWFNFQC